MNPVTTVTGAKKDEVGDRKYFSSVVENNIFPSTDQRHGYAMVMLLVLFL